MAQDSVNYKGLYNEKVFVEYAGQGWGLNTREDVHALDRDALSVSINGWPSHKSVIGKRPASTNYINTTTGGTGLGSVTTVVITTGTTFTVPANFVSLVSVEVVGGGAGGSGNGGGGGGGAYAKIVTLGGMGPGSVYPIQIGAGGGQGTNGTATWFSTTGTLFAAPGSATSTITGGAGGTTGASIGSTKFAGGAGGNGNGAGGGGGGGGAAGLNAAGNPGVTALAGLGAAGGSGDGGSGGAGGIGSINVPAGNGGAGTEWGTAGSGGGGGGDDSGTDGAGNDGLYGGGGGGTIFGSAANGANGVIVFRYHTTTLVTGSQSIVATRWTISGKSTTVLLAQSGSSLAFAAVGATTWTPIITTMGAGAQRIHVAQMADSGVTQCFICNGVDQPWMWAGPGHTTLTQTSVANGLPVDANGIVGIAPRFVTTVGNNSVLVYSGEKTSPTAVYVSDAFKPQSFTQSSAATTVYPGSYQPYLVGFNDGVNGGNVTGITSLQGNIICYKESSIYRGQFTGVYSSVYGFQWQTVSSQVGLVAPESLVSFDTYDVFESQDGVNYTDGYQVQELSTNVPTFFDASLDGYAPLCLNDPVSVGVRLGQRYVIWYDRGLPSNPGVPAGYPTSGVWFDMSQTDQDGFPKTGEMHGALSQYPFTATMPVAGACSLNGPNDNGLFVWTNATADQVSLFGVGFSEYGGAISTTFAGPADRFAQVAADSAFFSFKHVYRAWFAIAAALTTTSQLTFNATFTTDFLMTTSSGALTPVIPGTGTAVFGVGVFGTSVFGAAGGSTLYAPVTFTPGADGRMIQTMIQEQSTTQWLLLGYTLEVAARLPVQ